MAEVAELFPYLDGDDEEALELEEADGEAFDGSPYWPSALVPNLFSPIFSSGRRSSPSSSDHVDSTSDSSECVYNQIFFPHDDGFEHMPPSPPIDHPLPETLDFRNFRVLDAIDDCVDLDETDEGESGHRIFTGSRVTGGVPSAGGLRVVDLGSDTNSSSDDRGFAGPDFDSGGGASGRLEGDLGLPLCWDFLPIDDVRGDPSEDFEWEEVDDRLDGRGVLSMMVGIDDEGVSRGRGEIEDGQLVLDEARGEWEEEDAIDRGRNVVWEVLLAMSSHGMTRSNSASSVEHIEALSDFGDDPELYMNPSDYEFNVGQFTEHDSLIRGRPPAAKLVVSNLPSILITEKDVANNGSFCAVCKDEFVLSEKATQLPCSHHYHEHCISPWLGMRNTCPVCRFELPTDDPDYERSKVRLRARDAATSVESLLRSDTDLPSIL